MTKKYLEWNAAGLIPGPEETEDEYVNRVHYCLNLIQELNSQKDTHFPFEVSDHKSRMILEKSLTKTESLYGIAPDWVPLFFSNYQLSPWQGGCAWIFQLAEETPTAAFLQLRAHFLLNEKYLGLYDREELIEHELSHVGRMMYKEPQFEEILAYRSSSKWWRRWFGPIVQSSKESLFFILLMGFIILADLALISLDGEKIYQLLFWLKLIPFGVIILGLIRLGRRQFIFNKALKKLTVLFKDQGQKILYRLTDKEIKLMACSLSNHIAQYIQEQKSFRWDFLKNCYNLKGF